MFRIHSQHLLIQENQQLKQQYNNLVQHTNKLQEENNRMKLGKSNDIAQNDIAQNEKQTHVLSFLKQKNAKLSQEIVKKNQLLQQLNGRFVLTSCSPKCSNDNVLSSMSDTISDLTQ